MRASKFSSSFPISTGEEGFCRVNLKDMEVLVETSSEPYFFVDIMAKSYLSQQDTAEFLEAIISEIRRLCSVPKGRRGATLVEAIIRPDCVGEDIIMCCDRRQSVPVATLEQLVESVPGLKCLKFCWPAVKDGCGNTILPTTLYEPRDLLGPTRSGYKPEEVCYPDFNAAAGRRRGVAVIVSMVHYHLNFGNRIGGLEDEDKLIRLCADLQFEVKLLHDLRVGELQQEIQEIATTSIRAQDESFLCFVMGHGDSFDGEEFILDRNGDVIMLDEIVRPFTECEHLDDKPKVFFLISCRGFYRSQPEWSKASEVRYLEEFPDCLIVFSAAQGVVSVRGEDCTPVVRALVANFKRDKRQKMDILKILTHVNKMVIAEEEQMDGSVSGQSPFVMHTLTRLLYWKEQR